MMGLGGGSQEKLRPDGLSCGNVGLGGRIFTGFLPPLVFGHALSLRFRDEACFEISDTPTKNSSSSDSPEDVFSWLCVVEQAMSRVQQSFSTPGGK